MSTVAYTWQNLDESERLEAVLAQGPPAYEWGCRSSDDFVLATQEVTMWFSSPHELVTWFGTTLELDAESEATTDARAQLRELAERANDMDVLALREELAARLSGRTAIGWLGTFDELCNASHAQARELRVEFREYEDEPVSDESIVDDQRARFAEFLTEHWQL